MDKDKIPSHDFPNLSHDLKVIDASQLPVTGIDSLPDILFKYRNWNNPCHKSNLINNEIFVSSIQNLNDPFDSAVNPLITLKASDALMKKMIKINVGNARFSQEGFKKALSDFSKKINNDIQRDFSNIGIFSLSSTPHNNLMWSHYANSHQGFCIGYNVSELIKQISKVTEHVTDLGGCMAVKYIEYFPNVQFQMEIDENFKLNPELVQRIMSTKVILKSDDWKYEKEFRIFMHPFINLSIPLNPDCVSEIILGLRMTQNDKNELCSLANSRYPNLKIRQMIMTSKNTLESEVI